LVSSGKDNAVFALSSGVMLRIQLAGKKDWGLQMAACTGAKAHLKKLTAVTGALRGLKTSFPTEEAFYRNFGLEYIEPELREGYDEVERAAMNALPRLVTAKDIRVTFTRIRHRAMAAIPSRTWRKPRENAVTNILASAITPRA